MQEINQSLKRLQLLTDKEHPQLIDIDAALQQAQALYILLLEQRAAMDEAPRASATIIVPEEAAPAPSTEAVQAEKTAAVFNPVEELLHIEEEETKPVTSREQEDTVPGNTAIELSLSGETYPGKQTLTFEDLETSGAQENPATGKPKAEASSPKEKLDSFVNKIKTTEASITEKLKKILFPEDDEDDELVIEPELSKDRNSGKTGNEHTETTAVNPAKEEIDPEEKTEQRPVTFDDFEVKKTESTTGTNNDSKHKETVPGFDSFADASITTAEKPASESIPQHRQSYNRPLQFEKLIGINDKYQYIAELFNGDKAVFESTVERINATPDYDSAKNWIDSTIATQYNWQEESFTVQDFYHLLQVLYEKKA